MNKAYIVHESDGWGDHTIVAIFEKKKEGAEMYIKTYENELICEDYYYISEHTVFKNLNEFSKIKKREEI